MNDDDFNVIEYLTARSVRTPLSEGGCWLWQAYINPDGYGQFHRKGRTYYVHRESMRAHGYDVDGMSVDHLCGNRNCWHPLHLEIVTREENGIRRADQRWGIFRRYALRDQPGALNGHVVQADELDAA
jgi:hypothetical protein